MHMNKRFQSLKLAPAVEDIFARPDYHRAYLLPLLSLDLADVFDDLSGPIHFIDPIEPYDGCLGEMTSAFHSYYCRENWISFRLKDGRYDCEASENFFEKTYLKTHPVPASIHESVRAGWVAAVEEHYRKRRAKYDKWREVVAVDLDAALSDHGIQSDNFGGRPYDANWSNMDTFPLAVDKIDVPGETLPDTFCYPLTEDGRRFRYVGFVESFDWRCAIHLFYDPVEQRALQTFDWT